MVATGLLGLLATGMMKMNEIQMKNSKNAETKNEITALHSKLNQYLLDSKSCEQTFRAVDTSLTGASLSLGSIKNKSGTNVYVVNNIYGNNTVKITAMNLVPDGSTTLDIATSGSKNFILYVKYKKNSKMTAQNTITKKINLVIQRDSSDVITCYSQLNNAVATAKSQICTDLGGTINATGHCDITASTTVQDIAKKAACNAITGASFASGMCTLPAAAPVKGTIVELSQQKCPSGSTLISKFWDALTSLNYWRSCGSPATWSLKATSCSYCSKRNTNCRTCGCARSVTRSSSGWSIVRCRY